ncbi:uncharacterized protein [Spinacia oleracea]|uniref:ATP-dependent DNA helicase n=1 Tax=Spinacia oleracea TaxID=3562 RepID=A0ABM3RQU8_SPIOL|nr:uncharacterized protein LOC130471738 [Spinacia oleracea]
MGEIVLLTATPGIAAANIPSGRTTYSRFKIPIDTEASLACDVSKQESLAALIHATTLIIWDEDLMVLPVLPRKTQLEAVAVSLVSSSLWPKLTKSRLTENIRAREDPGFYEFLLALGNGELQTPDNSLVHLPSEVLKPLEDGKDPITDLTTLTFPELDLNNFSSDIFTTREILTPMNDDVYSINMDLIKKFLGVSVVYRSFNTMLDKNCNVYPTEFINTPCPGGMSPHELTLKMGSPVILLRNVLPSSGLCNGTRLICKGFFPSLIQCVIITVHRKGKYVFIPRVKLRPTASSKYPILFQRKQFPIKLNFAMAINKSQGQKLSQVKLMFTFLVHCRTMIRLKTWRLFEGGLIVMSHRVCTVNPSGMSGHRVFTVNLSSSDGPFEDLDAF